MTDRFDMARALLDEVQKQKAGVRKAYEAALHDHQVPTALQIAIKNTLENLRSALDYVALELAMRLGKAKPGAKVYFPIAAHGAKAADFPGLAERLLPGATGNQVLLGALTSSQAFAHPDNGWLPDLATLTIENKHVGLTPQTRKETRRIKAESPGGGSVSWDPGSVRFGSGVFINGVPVDPRTQMPVPSPTQIVTQEIWVAFTLDGVNRDTLAFLEMASAGVRAIVERMVKVAPSRAGA